MRARWYVDVRRGEIDARTERVVAPIPDFYRRT